MKYAIVDLPAVGESTVVRGTHESLRRVDDHLRCGMLLMRVVLDALGSNDAKERLESIVDALRGPLPDNVAVLNIRCDDVTSGNARRELVAATVAICTIVRSVVVASPQLEIGQRLRRHDVLRMALRANAIRARRRQRR